MSSQTESGGYELDHTVESGFDDGHEIATLDERAENRRQMQEIERRTVEPNLMKLPVIRVTSSNSNDKYVVDVRHPIHGQEDDGNDHFRFFLDKPINGWSREYKIVRMMDYYGIKSKDPHDIEFNDLYVEKNDSESDYHHGWMLVKPPEYDDPIRVQLRDHADRFIGALKRVLGGLSRLRFKREPERIWFMLLLSSVASTFGIAHAESMPVMLEVLVTMGIFFVGTVLGLLFFGGVN